MKTLNYLSWFWRQVLREVRSSYPNLTVLGDINIAKSAALKTRSDENIGDIGGAECHGVGHGKSKLVWHQYRHRRFSEDSVTGMIQDLFMLVKADFSVCPYTPSVGLVQTSFL